MQRLLIAILAILIAGGIALAAFALPGVVTPFLWRHQHLVTAIAPTIGGVGALIAGLIVIRLSQRSKSPAQPIKSSQDVLIQETIKL
jgi:hypothetical protein